MEKASLRELMESHIPKVDSFLSTGQFDSLFKSLNPESREVWYLGDAVCALIFRDGQKLTRIYRGNPDKWGVLAKRLALGDMGLETIASSPLGSGVLSGQMVAELEAEVRERDANDPAATVEQRVQYRKDWEQPESPPFLQRIRTNCQRRDNVPIPRQRLPRTKPLKKKAKKVKSKTRTRKKKTV